MVLYADIFEADTRTLLAISEISYADLRHEQVDRSKHDSNQEAPSATAPAEIPNEAATGEGDDV